MPPRDDARVSHCLMSTVIRSGVHQLRQGRELVFGRHPTNDVVLPHHGVSRRHARIQGSDGRYRLIDLNSSNGTFVNGERLHGAHPLEDNDVFSMGPFEFTYREFEGELQTLRDRSSLDPDATLPSDFVADFEEGIRFGGAFSTMELIEICQFLAINHKTGRLEVDGEERSGAIDFVGGKILDVSGGDWERRYEGVRELVSQQRGRFYFTSQQPEFSTARKPLPTIPLLMELCRQRDETLAIARGALGMLRPEEDR